MRPKPLMERGADLPAGPPMYGQVDDLRLGPPVSGLRGLADALDGLGPQPAMVSSIARASRCLIECLTPRMRGGLRDQANCHRYEAVHGALHRLPGHAVVVRRTAARRGQLAITEPEYARANSVSISFPLPISDACPANGGVAAGLARRIRGRRRRRKALCGRRVRRRG